MRKLIAIGFAAAVLAIVACSSEKTDGGSLSATGFQDDVTAVTGQIDDVFGTVSGADVYCAKFINETHVGTDHDVSDWRGIYAFVDNGYNFKYVTKVHLYAIKGVKSGDAWVYDWDPSEYPYYRNITIQ